MKQINSISININKLLTDKTNFINVSNYQQLNKKIFSHKEMSYQRVPQSFMKDIFIQPHSFSDPENPKHGQYVNMQLKNDLYFSALNQITNIEFQSFGNQDEWVQIQQIKPCQGQDPKTYWFADMYKKRNGRLLVPKQQGFIETIACEDWKVVSHRGSQKRQNKYRVKILQTKTDIFRSQVYPPTFFKVLKDLLAN